MTLDDLVGTSYTGHNRVWLDPDAPPEESAATIGFEPGVVKYTWAWEGNPEHGSVTWRRTGGGAAEATFTDTWHQKRPMTCLGTVDQGALLRVEGLYSAPGAPPWGWRTIVALREAHEGKPAAVVLEMVNLYPWGEEHRAVMLVAPLP